MQLLRRTNHYTNWRKIFRPHSTNSDRKNIHFVYEYATLLRVNNEYMEKRIAEMCKNLSLRGNRNIYMLNG